MNIVATIGKAIGRTPQAPGEPEHPGSERTPAGLKTRAWNAAAENEVDRSLLEALEQELDEASVPEDERQTILVEGWKGAARALAKGYMAISLERQNSLARFANHFQLTLEVLDEDGAYAAVLKSAVLRDVEDGITPELQLAPGAQHPFGLQPGEKLVWVMEEVGYYRNIRVEEPDSVIHVHNLTLAPGLYVGPETFPARPTAERQECQADTGLLGLTDLGLHFAGPLESFRVGHDEIQLYDYIGEGESSGIRFGHKGIRAGIERLDTPDNRFTRRLTANLSLSLREQRKQEAQE